MTWGLASYCVLRAARHKSDGGMDAMYISYSQEMTREFIDACAMWAKAFAMAALDVEESLFEDTDEDGKTHAIAAFRIRFASGFEILALSSAPRSLRGKQGLVVIDEAAFVEHLGELIKAAMAFLMWGGQVVICSTHDGVDNAFNELVEEIRAGRKPYQLMRVDLDDALAQGLFQRICLVRGMAWTPEAEAQWRAELIAFYGSGADEELFCIPSQGEGTWLSGPLIESRMNGTAPVLRFELPADYLQRTDAERRHLIGQIRDDLEDAFEGLETGLLTGIGMDFARKVDLSVITALGIGPALRREALLVVELRRVPHREQFAILKAIRDLFPRLIGMQIDAGGSGSWIAEEAAREFGALVEEVLFSEGWYREQMPPLKTAFEDDTILLPPDAEHLNDLRNVKKVRGVPRVPDQRTGDTNAKRHGDFAISLALAYAATRMAAQEFDYRPAPGSATRPRHQRGRLTMQPEDDLDEISRNPFAGPVGARLRGGI